MSATEFKIFGKDIKGDGAILFSFPFPKAPFPDLEGRPTDGVKGMCRWVPGDRIRYDTAYWFLGHEDPGHHAELDGFRIAFQGYGYSFQLNDEGMPELGEDGGGTAQGLPPYPYEADAAPIAVDKTRPAGDAGAGTLEFFHQRGFEPELKHKGKGRQLLARWTIPAVSKENAKVKWYYQLGGLWVAVHDTHGVFCRVIVTAMHPRYGYGVKNIRNTVTPR